MITNGKKETKVMKYLRGGFLAWKLISIDIFASIKLETSNDTLRYI